MTIAVDCRMLDASGIGVYLRGILPFFLQSGHDFLLLGNAQRLRSFADNPKVTIISCDIQPFSVKELLFFPVKTARQLNKACVFYSPFFNIPPLSIAVFSTIHDIIFPDMPEITSRAGLAVRMWFFRRAYKKSQKIFTVSQFSKSRIEFHLGKTKSVIVSSGGIQQKLLEYRKKNPDIKKTQTIVFIGNIKKHKGLDYLLDAFFMARNEGLQHKLFIIGEKEKFRSGDNSIFQKFNSLGSEAVSFTGFISDEQLMEYLAEASLLVQPSLYEGFGFPPLEAMVLGTYALISDIPVFKEIYSDFPVTFFRAGDSEDLKEKMLELLLNKDPPLSVLSDELLLKYTFEKTASRILKELE